MKFQKKFIYFFERNGFARIDLLHAIRYIFLFRSTPQKGCRCCRG